MLCSDESSQNYVTPSLCADRQCKGKTTDCGLRTADCGLRTADCGLRTTDYGLRTADCRPGVKCRLQTGVKCRLQTNGKMQARGKMKNEDRRLGVYCRMKTTGCGAGETEMREKTAGNTSALVEVRRNLLKPF